MTSRHYQRSLRWLQAEMLITTAVFAMPIINLFFAREIGMTLTQVGLSQAIFTVVLFGLNIPTGWIADRFSRKACNALGDLVAAAGFAYYAQAASFGDVIIAEVVVGIGMAFSGGADVALLRAYSLALQVPYLRISAQLNTWRPVSEIAASIIGGLVGAWQPRATFLLTALAFVVGAIISLFIREAGERRVNTVHPLRDMARITRYALHGHGQLAWSIAGAAIGREASHAMVWLLTPVLLLAGVPPVALGVCWAANLLAVSAGAAAAHRWAEASREWQRFAIGLACMVIAGTALAVLPLHVATVWLYVGFGLGRGWMSAVLPALVQDHTPSDIQATVSSVAASVSQFVYIPLVWGIGALAEHSVPLAFAGNTLLFLPLGVVIAYQLARYERR